MSWPSLRTGSHPHTPRRRSNKSPTCRSPWCSRSRNTPQGYRPSTLHFHTLVPALASRCERPCHHHRRRRCWRRDTSIGSRPVSRTSTSQSLCPSFSLARAPDAPACPIDIRYRLPLSPDPPTPGPCAFTASRLGCRAPASLSLCLSLGLDIDRSRGDIFVFPQNCLWDPSRTPRTGSRSPNTPKGTNRISLGIAVATMVTARATRAGCLKASGVAGPRAAIFARPAGRSRGAAGPPRGREARTVGLGLRRSVGGRAKATRRAAGAVVEHVGSLDGAGLKVGIVVARFNDLITRPLMEGAVDTFERYGVDLSDVEVGAAEAEPCAGRMTDVTSSSPSSPPNQSLFVFRSPPRWWPRSFGFPAPLRFLSSPSRWPPRASTT